MLNRFLTFTQNAKKAAKVRTLMAAWLPSVSEEAVRLRLAPGGVSVGVRVTTRVRRFCAVKMLSR